VKASLPAVPDAVAPVSARDIWAVGTTLGKHSRTVLMHWTGRHWSTSSFPAHGVSPNLGGFTATGPGDLWLGVFPVKAGAREYLLHGNGTSWKKVALPGRDTTLGSFVSDGHGGLWATGVGPNPKPVQLFLHWSAGHWTSSRVPFTATDKTGQVDELALIPGTRSVWAIGHVYGPGADTILNRGGIWRYNP
jgi:hypothetical protein